MGIQGVAAGGCGWVGPAELGVGLPGVATQQVLDRRRRPKLQHTSMFIRGSIHLVYLTLHFLTRDF